MAPEQERLIREADTYIRKVLVNEALSTVGKEALLSAHDLLIAAVTPS